MKHSKLGHVVGIRVTIDDARVARNGVSHLLLERQVLLCTSMRTSKRTQQDANADSTRVEGVKNGLDRSEFLVRHAVSLHHLLDREDRTRHHLHCLAVRDCVNSYSAVTVVYVSQHICEGDSVVVGST